jgi:hypothetical protein
MERKISRAIERIGRPGLINSGRPSKRRNTIIKRKQLQHSSCQEALSLKRNSEEALRPPSGP